MTAQFSQGAESNLSGLSLEHAIEYEFSARQIAVRSYSQNGNNHELFLKRMLLTNVPYTSAFGCYSRSEFVYRDDPLELRIECRRQDGPGSCDEKFPYFFMNALLMPEMNVWLIIDGTGARTAALNWIKKQCLRTSSWANIVPHVENKVIRIFNLTEARLAIKALLTKGIV